MTPYKPKVKAPDPALIAHTTRILRQNGITTVCEESACPNRTECYAARTATFMILGDTCTRACRFCNVKTGRGLPPDPIEPRRIVNAARELGLGYVVITSVDRDDLEDLGAGQFVAVTRALKEALPHVKVELLTPDFKGDEGLLGRIVSCGADKLAHNEETVRRLSPAVRPQSDYDRSLRVLHYYASHFPDGKVKSSLMVGLGESPKELEETMIELRKAGVEELTIGQYLQPSPHHLPVVRYYDTSFFRLMKEKAYRIGFSAVASAPLMRSSYHAKQLN